VDSGALRGHTVAEEYKGARRWLRLDENSRGGDEHDNGARVISTLSRESKKEMGGRGVAGSGSCGKEERGGVRRKRR
jgi:hypothetical protein